VPVLPDAVRDLLAPALRHDGSSGVVFDGTLGRGGHAADLMATLPIRAYVATDLDADNLAYARDRLTPLAAAQGITLHLHHGSFTAAGDVLAAAGTDRPAALLADLGFASNQVDDPRRGLAFSQDGPLDMRLDPTADGPTAADLVNTLPVDELADVIYGLGDERFSRRIARKIVDFRTQTPIQSTEQLARIVRAAYPPSKPGPTKRTRYGGRVRPGPRLDPATRTFQALRIAVNGELDALDTLLAQLPELMAPQGRAALISFHSLEDRRVKHAFLHHQQHDRGTRVTRKPVTTDETEQARNPRSRSAKLRVFQFT
jgi:16S rRNA (cytosine1402-N4)-methyltransferase